MLHTVIDIPSLEFNNNHNVSRNISNVGMYKALSSSEKFTHLPEAPHIAINIARYALV